MDEYIKREALNKWCHEVMKTQITTAGMTYVRDFWNIVQSIPAADVIRVPRCHECENDADPTKWHLCEVCYGDKPLINNFAPKKEE